MLSAFLRFLSDPLRQEEGMQPQSGEESPAVEAQSKSIGGFFGTATIFGRRQSEEDSGIQVLELITGFWRD